MAKSDRNQDYMLETFGTKHLVTDYGVDVPLAPEKSEPKQETKTDEPNL